MIVVFCTSSDDGKCGFIQLGARFCDKLANPFFCFLLDGVNCFRHLFLLPTYYLAGVPGLEPGPKVLETSMLTIDTIPLYQFGFRLNIG